MRHRLCLATTLSVLGRILGLGVVLGAAGAAQADPLVPVAAEAKPRELSPHALALRARWVTAPAWSLSPYTDQRVGLDAGYGVGLEYLYRRAGFDVVVSVDYSGINPPDGNFRGKGNDPATETHFLTFRNLSVLSADVSLIGHWNVLPWLEIRFGGGLGLGGVFGDISQITNNSGCTAENGGDPTRCYPKNVGPLNRPGVSNDEVLAGFGCRNGDGSLDTPSSPCYRRVDTYPMNARVVPVINTLLGLRFQAHEHVYIHVDAGWRLVGFYLGAGPEFRF